MSRDRETTFDAGMPSDEALDPDTLHLAFGTHEGRRRKKARKLPGEDIGHLNLVPMMDIMTILLVFLVKSFATEPANINVNLQLKPPESTATEVMKPATTVTVTSDAILVENDEILKLSDIENPGRGSDPKVLQALLERAEHLRTLESMGGAKFDGRLLVVAHETTSYAMVTTVLVSAGEAHFSEYKLVVMQKGGG